MLGYTEDHVLLNLLNELGKKMNILSVFPNEFNKITNIGARMQDFVYYMTLKSHFISESTFAKVHDPPHHLS